MRVFGGVIRLERLLLPQDQGLGWTASLQPKALPCCEGRSLRPNCWKQVRNQPQPHGGKICGVNWVGLCRTGLSKVGNKHLKVSKYLSVRAGWNKSWPHHARTRRFPVKQSDCELNSSQGSPFSQSPRFIRGIFCLRILGISKAAKVLTIFIIHL